MRCGTSPLTRIPLPSHAAAAACLSTPVPPAIRHAGLWRCLQFEARHRIPPLSRTRPRATACCRLHARPNVRPARFPARCSAMAVEESPPFARDRDVALGALAVRRPFCRAIAARHVGHLPVPSHARLFVRQRPRKAASERGRLYQSHHYARITRVLITPLAATGLDVTFALCHYPRGPYNFDTRPQARDILQLPLVVTEGSSARSTPWPPSSIRHARSTTTPFHPKRPLRLSPCRADHGRKSFRPW